MVDTLLDTSVVIDILRLNASANQWFAQQNIQFWVSQIVQVEVLQGASNKQDQANALKLLQRFDPIDLTSSDYDWAIQHLLRYKLSHSVGGLDCLIASTSYHLQIPLYTMNIKHFTPILGTLAQRPY